MKTAARHVWNGGLARSTRTTPRTMSLQGYTAFRVPVLLPVPHNPVGATALFSSQSYCSILVPSPEITPHCRCDPDQTPKVYGRPQHANTINSHPPAAFHAKRGTLPTAPRGLPPLRSHRKHSPAFCHCFAAATRIAEGPSALRTGTWTAQHSMMQHIPATPRLAG